MKAIILAAGMGTRLMPYTKDIPKGMLQFQNKSLIERQIDTLRSSGITDITIIKGYMPDAINFPGTKEYTNEDFANTNMVESLFCAREELEGDVLIAYADILYEPRIITAVKDATCNVGVVYDTDYTEYWSARLENPNDDQESFLVNAEGLVTQLGTPSPSKEEINGRYVGLIKLSAEGCNKFKSVYDSHKAKSVDEEPWYNSTSFKKGYMTDMIQAMIDNNVPVTGIPVERGWLEFDTSDDYEIYNKWIEEGTLNYFYQI